MKTRAKYAILNYILLHCIAKKCGNDIYQVYDKSDAFDINAFLKPQVGDLVSLRGVINADKWYLSWCIDIKETGNEFTRKYLLESIEDGSLCWWHNVGFAKIDNDIVQKNKHWKWTDKQFQLQDKWNRVCSKNKQSFHLYGGGLEFDGNTVTLKIKNSPINPDHSPIFYKYKFENWKKIKVSDMNKFWQDAITQSNKK